MEKLSRFQRLKNKIYYNIFVEFNNSKKIDFQFSKEMRWDLINEIIKKKNIKSYLEIGCDDNLLFDKIKLDGKIGIDPRQGGNMKTTSDNFFSTNQKYFDLVFIDGLHEFEQVNKDIENSLNFLNNGGYILLHDCLPTQCDIQAVPRYRHYWTGDVWKSIVKFRHRKDLFIQTLLIDMGVGIIQKKENPNPLNLNINNFKKLKFSDFYQNHQTFMNEISYKDFIKNI